MTKVRSGKLAVSALGFLLGAGLLGACGGLSAPQEREYVMTVRSVEFPKTAAPTEPLTVTVEVEFGGCQTFKELRATRTESKLTLRAIGTEKYGPGVHCAAYLGWSKEKYVDAGAPPRTNPFEIVVNDQSRGSVQVVGEQKTVSAQFIDVLFPRAVTPTGPLTVTGRSIWSCTTTDPTYRVLSRTANKLELATSQTINYNPDLTCPAIYVENLTSHTDEGTVPRQNPFQIVIDGKVYGTVQVAEKVAADPSERVVSLPKGTLSPWSVAATAPLHLTLAADMGFTELAPGTCIRYRLDVQRTASRLQTDVIERKDTAPNCPAIQSGWWQLNYVDAPTPARTNPFEVVVSGKSWGTVEVK